MVKQDALMESISSNLHGFLQSIEVPLSGPDKKFLRDGFIGLIRAGHPIVCQMAREVPNQRSEYTTRVKRWKYCLCGQSRRMHGNANWKFHFLKIQNHLF